MTDTSPQIAIVEPLRPLRGDTDPALLFRHLTDRPSRWVRTADLWRELQWAKNRTSFAMSALKRKGYLDIHPKDAHRSRNYRFRPSDRGLQSISLSPPNVIDIAEPPEPRDTIDQAMGTDRPDVVAIEIGRTIAALDGHRLIAVRESRSISVALEALRAILK